MSRYIDADEFTKILRLFPSEKSINVRSIEAAIDSMETADVVEVVRCRDCKYYKSHRETYDSVFYWCEWFESEATMPYDYCSHGRRTDVCD